MAEIRIAAAQYPIDSFADFAGFEAKLEHWVAQAAGEGANLLVFPEYAAMELTSLFGPEVSGDVQKSFDAVTTLLPRLDAANAHAARRHKVHILAGGLAHRRGSLTPNSSRLFTPTGQMGVQDKQMMTRGEREWGVAPDGPIRVFETSLGLIGISICYDVEFPLIARAQALAGAHVILAPSCTETLAGYSRVHIGAMARALESQCVTVQSPLVGEALWSAVVDRNTGRAGIFGPPDRGFPATGMIAEGPLNKPQWVYGAADLAAIDEVRRDGTVLNMHHWDEQHGAVVPPAEVVTLG